MQQFSTYYVKHVVPSTINLYLNTRRRIDMDSDLFGRTVCEPLSMNNNLSEFLILPELSLQMECWEWNWTSTC